MKLLASVCFLLTCLNIHFAYGYVVGVGYNYYDARYRQFNHGNEIDKRRVGGTCKEFLELNGINQCCASREDDCYMIHFDTRCYCDNFCDRPHSDCCQDAAAVCGGYHIPETTPPPPPPPVLNDCYVNGYYYSNGDKFRDNCNECTCANGQIICSQNRCLVDVRLLSDINADSRIGWRAGNYSNFWGRTLDYGYGRKLGTRLPAQKQKPLDPFADNEESKDIPIPSRYDFREDPEVRASLRPNPIRDQGDCAASWAFSTVDVATDRLVKVTKGKHGNQTTYSVQNLISCVIFRDDRNNGCQPSTTDIAWNRLNYNDNEGIVEERCWTYSNGDKQRAEQCLIPKGKKSISCPTPGNSVPYDGSLLLASPVYPLKVEHEDDIKREILLQGPVQAIFRVYTDFFMYRSGVYKWSRKAPEYNHRDPYHSVKILGWGTENGEDYWLCANSWGDQWGENGYFKIKRGECEINNHIFAAWGNSKVNGKLVYNHKTLLNRVQSMYSSI